MGEVILRDHVRRSADLAAVHVTSAGTARWHVGKPMDHRASAALRRGGYSDDASLGAWATPEFLHDIDLAVAMTREHRSDLLARRPDLSIVLVRELLGEGSLDVPDPYFGNDNDFDICRETLERAIPALLREIRRGLDPSTSRAAT
jgi:protein-tyrosine phosphatase